MNKTAKGPKFEYFDLRGVLMSACKVWVCRFASRTVLAMAMATVTARGFALYNITAAKKVLSVLALGMK